MDVDQQPYMQSRQWSCMSNRKKKEKMQSDKENRNKIIIKLQ